MNKVYKLFLRKYVFAQKKYFILVCLVTVMQSMITMFIPLTCRELLDKAFPEKDMHRFLQMVAVMLGCYIGAAVLNVAKDYFLAKLAEGLSFRLRTELNRKISVMKYSYFDTHSLSEVLSKYSKEVEAVKENCGYMLVKTLSNIITFLLASAMIIAMDWKVMLVSIFLLVLFIINNRFWGKKVKELAEKSMACNEEAINSITENFRNVLITKLYSAYAYVNDKFNEIYKKQFKNQIHLELVYSVNLNSGGLLSYFLAAVIWIIGGFGVLAGSLTIGTVTALINYQGMLIAPMAFFSEFNNSYQSTVIAMKRLYGILLYEEENIEGCMLAGNKIDNISFSDVDFQYVENASVLQGINLQLKKGEMTAFIGGSGCGKSSLVKMILKLYPPRNGEIRINGQSLSDISVNSLRERISFVAQDSLFFKGSILENLRMGKTLEDNRLIEFSRWLDLYDEIMDLPERWETELNAGTSNLSGGQKKRLDVLRALIRDADVIIFDESTASIDVERRRKLFDILEKIKQDKIIIFITHNIEECSHFDNIYAVKNKSVLPINHQNLAEAY